MTEVRDIAAEGAALAKHHRGLALRRLDARQEDGRIQVPLDRQLRLVRDRIEWNGPVQAQDAAAEPVAAREVVATAGKNDDGTSHVRELVKNRQKRGEGEALILSGGKISRMRVKELNNIGPRFQLVPQVACHGPRQYLQERLGSLLIREEKRSSGMSFSDQIVKQGVGRPGETEKGLVIPHDLPSCSSVR